MFILDITGMKQNKDNAMKVIGITGGVGAGKTKVLEYIKVSCKCRLILADEVGNKVKEPGQKCYQRLVNLLGEHILNDDKTINKAAMANAIFKDKLLLLKVNSIIHPAVTEYILSEIDKEKKAGYFDFFFIEAALLIECGYDAYVDEMWYIYADEATRKKRLLKFRSYSDDKTESIMKGQLSEEEFKKHCEVTIDNSLDFEYTKKQIDEKLGELLWKMQKNTQDN